MTRHDYLSYLVASLGNLADANFIFTSKTEETIVKNITLHVLPRQEISWINFLADQYPVNSIALDGFIIGGPSFDYAQRKVNFDHHSGVVRSATMSTCMQVYLAIKEGLFDLFAGKKPNVYINDCDQDTALAV